MTDTPADAQRRYERILELAYGVHGVLIARVWGWDGKVAVAVRGAGSTVDLVKRVEDALEPLKEPNELWEFGLLDEG